MPWPANLAIMSFQITATVHDGQVQVTTTAEVPDGIYTLSGHTDANTVTLGAEVRDLAGRYRGGVNYQHSLEE